MGGDIKKKRGRWGVCGVIDRRKGTGVAIVEDNGEEMSVKTAEEIKFGRTKEEREVPVVF